MVAAPFAVMLPENDIVMFVVRPTMFAVRIEYHRETVAPDAAPPWPFVNSRSFVHVLPAESVTVVWSFVFPSVVVRLSVAMQRIASFPALMLDPWVHTQDEAADLTCDADCEVSAENATGRQPVTENATDAMTTVLWPFDNTERLAVQSAGPDDHRYVPPSVNARW